MTERAFVGSVANHRGVTVTPPVVRSPEQSDPCRRVPSNERSERGNETVDREKSLDMALGQIEKSFGKGSIMKMGEKGTMRVEAVSTGALALDIALGVGGLPRGRVVEIFGPESSGKSTMAMHVVA